MKWVFFHILVYPSSFQDLLLQSFSLPPLISDVCTVNWNQKQRAKVCAGIYFFTFLHIVSSRGATIWKKLQVLAGASKPYELILSHSVSFYWRIFSFSFFLVLSPILADFKLQSAWWDRLSASLISRERNLGWGGQRWQKVDVKHYCNILDVIFVSKLNAELSI